MCLSTVISVFPHLHLSFLRHYIPQLLQASRSLTPDFSAGRVRSYLLSHQLKSCSNKTREAVKMDSPTSSSCHDISSPELGNVSRTAVQDSQSNKITSYFQFVARQPPRRANRVSFRDLPYEIREEIYKQFDSLSTQCCVGCQTTRNSPILVCECIAPPILAAVRIRTKLTMNSFPTRDGPLHI